MNPAFPRRFTSTTPRWHALALASALVALLAGCGGGDDDTATDPETPPVTGSVVVGASLGAIVNGAISITCPLTGTTLGTATTAANAATTTVATQGSCAGPLMVTVRGAADGSSTYFDEATASVLALPQAAEVRALVPTWAANLSVAVTPLTEIATRRALAQASSAAAVTAAQALAANSAVVSQVLGNAVALDILSLPTVWSSATAPGSLGTSAADRYALYLAALAHMARGQASPALAAMAALAADLADGNLNGSTEGFTYAAAAFSAQLGSSLTALATYATPELQQALNITPVAALAATSFSPAQGAAGTVVTLTGTGFDPDPFHMLVKFANNLTAEVVSSSATQLVVKVPNGAVSGPIVVTKTLTGESVTTSASFTVSATESPVNSETWVSRASPTGFVLNGLAYGNGKFVAVGFGKTVTTSANGLSWTAAQGPADSGYYDIKSVAWVGNQFVMVGDTVFGSTQPPLIATSPDGVSWTRRSWTPGAIAETALSAVSAGGGKLTAVGLNGVIVSSTDGGATWAVESQSTVASFTGVAGNDTVRVAVGRDGSYAGKILVDAGAGWVSATVPSGFYPRAVAWTGQFVAVGSASAGLSAPVVATSPDGVTWTLRSLDGVVASGFPLVAVVRSGDTLYATGDNASNKHVIVKSADAGATWTLVHEGTTNGIAALTGIAASSDRVVTVGGVKSVTLP